MSDERDCGVIKLDVERTARCTVLGAQPSILPGTRLECSDGRETEVVRGRAGMQLQLRFQQGLHSSGMSLDQSYKLGDQHKMKIQNTLLKNQEFEDSDGAPPEPSWLGS